MESVKENTIEFDDNKSSNKSINPKDLVSSSEASINYFAQENLRNLDDKALILIKDFYTPFSIILRKSIAIINSSSFELIHEVRNIPDSFNLDNPEKVVPFQHLKTNYLLIYFDKIFAIFNLNLKDYNNYVMFQIHQLEDNERIINIKPLNNDLKLPYFILITSNMNIFILSIINLNPQSNFLNDTYFDTVKITENQGIFKKLSSYLLSSKASLETDKMFILNPSYNGLLYKNNSKHENSIFLISDNMLKIIEFSFMNNRLKGEIAFQLNILSIIKERIKSYNNRFSKVEIKSISVEDADVYFDQNSNIYSIYLIVKINEYYYILKMRIDSNFRISSEILEDVFTLDNNYLQSLINKVKKAKLFLNKIQNEFYVILSTDEISLIMFFSSNLINKGVCYKKAYAPIDGISTLFIGDKSYLCVLFDKNILMKIIFDLKTNNLIFEDITTEFTKRIMINKYSLIKPLENRMQDLSYMDSNSIMSEENYIPTKNFYSEAKIGKRLNQMDKNFNEKLNFNDNEDVAQIEDNVIFLITNKLKKYHDFKSGKSGINLNALYNISNDSEDLVKHLNNFQKDQNISLISIMRRIILNIVDNETMNINNINTNTRKAEIIIIEYLKERLENYQIFLNFLKDYKIFENFDQNKELYICCMEYKEKLICAIKLREQENFLLKNYVQDNNFSNLSSEQKLIQIACKFFDNCFEQYKCKYPEKSGFNKYSIYFKISNFDNYLKFLLDEFVSKLKRLDSSTEENLHLAFYLMNVFNLIFSEIKNMSYYFEYLNSNITDNFYLNFDFAIFQDFKNIKQSFWLFQNKEDILEKLEKLFRYLVVENTKEIITIKNNISEFSKSIIEFVDHLIFFNMLHYNFKESDTKKVDYEKKKRFYIKNIIEIDYEKSLQISIKYRCYFTIALICNIYKCPVKLKEYLDVLSQKEKFNTEIEYMLKIYLILDMEKKIKYQKENKVISASRIGNSADLKNQPNNSASLINKDKNLIFYFDYFDVFCDYHQFLKNIFSNYPKVDFFYEFYLRSKEGIFERNNRIDITSWEEFLNLEELFNSINDNNTLERVIKMLRYELNVVVSIYQEIEAALYSNNYDKIYFEKEFQNKENFVRKKYLLINLFFEVNLYEMHYDFVKSLGLMKSFNDQQIKYNVGKENIIINFTSIADFLQNYIIQKFKKGDYDFTQPNDNVEHNIRKLLILIYDYQSYFSLNEPSIENLVKLLIGLSILIDYSFFIRCDVKLKSLSDEDLLSIKNASILRKIKDTTKICYAINWVTDESFLDNIIHNTIQPDKRIYTDDFKIFLKSL